MAAYQLRGHQQCRRSQNEGGVPFQNMSTSCHIQQAAATPPTTTLPPPVHKHPHPSSHCCVVTPAPDTASTHDAHGPAVKEAEIPPTPPLTATTSSAQATAQVLPDGNSVVANEPVPQLQQSPAGTGPITAAHQTTPETVPTGWMNATAAMAWRAAHRIDATAAAQQLDSPIFNPAELVRGFIHTSGGKLLPTPTTQANTTGQQLPTGSVAPHTAAALPSSISSSGAVVRAQGAGPGQPWPAKDKLRNPRCMVSDSTTTSCITSPNGYFKLCVQPGEPLRVWCAVVEHGGTYIFSSMLPISLGLGRHLTLIGLSHHRYAVRSHL